MSDIIHMFSKNIDINDTLVNHFVNHKYKKDFPVSDTEYLVNQIALAERGRVKVNYDVYDDMYVYKV